jgi:hypothetical protein
MKKGISKMPSTIDFVNGDEGDRTPDLMNAILKFEFGRNYFIWQLLK